MVFFARARPPHHSHILERDPLPQKSLFATVIYQPQGKFTPKITQFMCMLIISRRVEVIVVRRMGIERSHHFLQFHIIIRRVEVLEVIVVRRIGIKRSHHFFHFQ